MNFNNTLSIKKVIHSKRWSVYDEKRKEKKNLVERVSASLGNNDRTAG